MSRLNRLVAVGAVGLLGAAVPLTAASAATPNPNPGPGGQGFPIGVTTPIGSVAIDPALACMPFEYSLGPFGPLGPWGPYGPLHDKQHPACFGGGPDFGK
jgi:hypothetical protein